MQSWIVDSNESNARLIEFLKIKISTLSAKKLKGMIERGACSVNGRRENFASVRVGKGDKIDFALLPEKQEIVIDASRLLFQDDDLLIYDKPAGISSDHTSFHKALERLSSPLYLLHRLDKETSGILMFAKSPDIHQAMIQLFRRHHVKKTYIAIVDGMPSKPKGSIDNYLGKIKPFEGQSLWGEVKPSEGQRARTEWLVEQKGKKASILILRPITGRTHQLRVHCSEMGHPILGDGLYGRQLKRGIGVDRCMLHAFEIAFEHPSTDEILQVQAPLPEDMKKIIQEMTPT